MEGNAKRPFSPAHGMRYPCVAIQGTGGFWKRVRSANRFLPCLLALGAAAGFAPHLAAQAAARWTTLSGPAQHDSAIALGLDR